MPILPEATRGPISRVREAVASMDYVVNSSPVASLLVAAMAIGLWYLHVELQYVVGAWLIYAAQRLSQKRISPTTLSIPPERRPEPQRQRPLRETIDNPLEAGPMDRPYV